MAVYYFYYYYYYYYDGDDDGGGGGGDDDDDVESKIIMMGGLHQAVLCKRTLGLSACLVEGTLLSQSLSPSSCVSELSLRGRGRGSHIKRMRVLIRDFEKNYLEVPRFCLVGVA